MAKRPVESEKFEKDFQEQLGFLEDSALAYDAGKQAEFKRMAVAIRILLHDTQSSTSLLSHLGQKNGLQLSDLATPLLDGNFGTDLGLVAIHGTPSVEGCFVPVYDMLRPGTIRPFDQWWSNPVMKDVQKRTISRKVLVLTAANQDGGAHVDSEIEETYYDLSASNSLNWFVGLDRDFANGKPLQGAGAAAVRQIAHEVLRTLKPDYRFAAPAAQGLMIAGVTLSVAVEGPPAPVRLPGLGGPPYIPQSRR